MLRQQDVGHRVVVRRIVGDQGGRTLFSDSLGELVELTETELTLVTARGTRRIPLIDVHRARRVPPARRPAADAVTALELAANEAWPAPVCDRMGDWLLRSAEGWTGRANSALPIGDPGRPLPAAIDAVRRWYASRGQPAIINVPLPLAAPVGAALDERGWGARPRTLVQTAPLAAILDAPPFPADLPPVELAPAPSADWLALAGNRKSLPPPDTAPGGTGTPDRNAPPAPAAPAPATPAAPEPVTPAAPALATPAAPGPVPLGAPGPAGLPAAAVHILTAVTELRFAHVYADPDTGRVGSHQVDPDTGQPRPGELLAMARGTITGGGRWLGISLVEVVPAARRRGLARQVIQALGRWAAQQGATHAFLQVEERNSAAVALYGRLGFSTHHSYLTRVEP